MQLQSNSCYHQIISTTFLVVDLRLLVLTWVCWSLCIVSISVNSDGNSGGGGGGGGSVLLGFWFRLVYLLFSLLFLILIVFIFFSCKKQSQKKIFQAMCVRRTTNIMNVAGT